MRYLAIIFIAFLLFPANSIARPVSYPDAWTVMLRNDVEQNSAHIHYTVDTQHSLGLRLRYDRDEDFTFVGAQLNRLLGRRNRPDSQANLYGRVGLGRVVDNHSSTDTRLKREDDTALFLGLSGDYETRRYFISVTAEYWDNGRFGDYSAYHGRVGIAPYVANTGALHTWVMLETHHRPENTDPLGASAILRFFKGPSLLELGIDNKGEPLLNYIHRF